MDEESVPYSVKYPSDYWYQVHNDIQLIIGYAKEIRKNEKYVTDDTWHTIRNARFDMWVARNAVINNKEHNDYRKRITNKLCKLKDDQVKSVFDYMEEKGWM